MRRTRASDRPRGRTVAIVGPDGAGKSTVVPLVTDRLGRDAVRIYMGINPTAATVALPTTRLLARLHARRAGGDVTRPTSDTSTDGTSWRSTLLVLNLMAEEALRQGIVRWHVRRGRIVLQDRDFLVDHWAHEVTDPVGRPWARRLHGHALRSWYRRPDLVVQLDADVDVLARRRPDMDPLELDRRRDELTRATTAIGRAVRVDTCLLYTSPSPRDLSTSRMPSSA